MWGIRIGACLLVVFTILSPRAAWAQACPNISITVNPTAPRYFPPQGNDTNPYPVRTSLDPNGINYKDCQDDIHFAYTVSIAGALQCADTMQVWVGTSTTDCSQTQSRQPNSGSPQCWPVTIPQTLETSFTIDIRARDIVAYISNPEPPEVYSPQPASEEGLPACQSQSLPGPVALTLYFMAFDGLAVDGFGTSSAVDVGLVGPYPPTNVTAGVGENLIVVNWIPATDATAQGFNIYCEDLGADIADGEAQEATLVCSDTGPSATNDGATESGNPDTQACVAINQTGSSLDGGSCESRFLVDTYSNGTVATIAGDDAGTDAAIPAGTAIGISEISSAYLCGTAGGNTATQSTVTGFADGGPGIEDFTRYAVGVAAVDSLGNVGILSPITCVTPAPVFTFWDLYLKDGGLAGGGYCAFRAPGAPFLGSFFGVGMSALTVAYARRRSKRR